MYKTITAFLALAAVSVFDVRAQSTEPVNFTIRYLPQTSYELYSNSQTSTTVTLTGITPATKKTLIAQGVTKPIVNIQKKEMLMKTVIGKPGSDKLCPVSYLLETFKTTKVTDEGESESISPLQSTAFYGNRTTEGKLQIDSMNNQNFTAVDKKAIINSFNTLLNQVQFPSKMLRPGDSFTQDMTLNMPLGADQMKILVQSTYTLQKKVDSLAYIDVRQVLTYNFTMGDKQKIQAGGGGSGKMIYNINHQYADLYETDLSIDLATVQNNTRSVVNVKVSNVQKAVVRTQTDK
jgi:hypothetical protein